MRSLLVFLIFDCIGRLPIQLRQWIGRSVGTLVSFIPTREREIAMLHLAKVFPEKNTPLLTRTVFQNAAQLVMESLNLAPLCSRDRVHIDNATLASIEALYHSKKGMLVLTAHCGNWDLLGSVFASLGYSIHTVGKEVRSPLMQGLLHEMRSRSGLNTIWRNDSQGVKQIISILREGGVVAALIDQDTTVTSVQVPFFGVPAKTPSSLITIAQKYGCHICVALIGREENQTFKVSFNTIPNTLSVEEILSQYHSLLEQHILRYPAQWVWFHKRWRTGADANTLGSTAYLEALRSGKILIRSSMIALSFFLLSCSWENYSLAHLHKAEGFAAENLYDNAITEYRLHIDTLSSLETRESWENPSFYRLKITDLLLSKGEPDAALKELLLAEKEGVDKDSISYRLRNIAQWYEEQGMFPKAIELLTKHRDRDPLLFNALLDEIARKQTVSRFQE